MVIRHVELSCDKQGRYYRNVGRKTGSKPDAYIQHKFRLGKDRKKAERALRRLLELWDCIERTQDQRNADRQHDDQRPALWDYVTMKIARAIVAGESSIAFDQNEGVGVRWGQLNDCPAPENAGNFAERLKKYARQFPVIAFEPAESSRDDFEQGEVALRERAEFYTAKANEARALAELRPIGNTMLHDAFEDFKDWVEVEYLHPNEDGERELTAWGHQQLRNMDRLKERHDNMPLGALNFNSVNEMFRLWRQRPNVKGTDNAMAVSTAKHHIKQLRAFFKWLHRSPEHDWVKFEGFDDIETKVHRMNNERGIRPGSMQVETYSLKELCLLNQHATPIERTLLLLGLNCGFKPAEMGSLTFSEVFLRQKHPHPELVNLSRNKRYSEITDADSFILRVRRKTGVWGEHLLLPQTVSAVEWAMKRRRAIKVVTRGADKGKDISATPDSPLLVSEAGVPYIHATTGHNRSQRIQNIWNALINRVRKTDPDFRRLPISCLRDTAGNFVRQHFNGEIMAVFLCHGQPVKSDEFAEQYSNRPHGRVFEAIAQMGEWLRPMFDAAPDNPFPEPQIIQRLKLERAG